MNEFEKHAKLTGFVQEMANTGRAPQEWTSFIQTLNKALHKPDVVSPLATAHVHQWNWISDTVQICSCGIERYSG